MRDEFLLSPHEDGRAVLSARLKVLSDVMLGVRTLAVLDAEGTIVWPCCAKKSRNDWRISAEVMEGMNGEQKGAGGRRKGYFRPGRLASGLQA